MSKGTGDRTPSRTALQETAPFLLQICAFQAAISRWEGRVTLVKHVPSPLQAPFSDMETEVRELALLPQVALSAYHEVAPLPSDNRLRESRVAIGSNKISNPVSFHS